MNQVAAKLSPVADVAQAAVGAILENREAAMKWLRTAGRTIGILAPVPGPGRFIASFVAGTAVGFAAGLAVAPASGSDTRKKIISLVTNAAQRNPMAKRVVTTVFGDRDARREPDGPGDAVAAEETRDGPGSEPIEVEAHGSERGRKRRNHHVAA